MILQTKSKNPKIRRYGCLFLSLLEIAERATGVSLSPHIDKIYRDAIDNDLMTENCYVKNHAAIIKLGLADSGSQAKYTGAEYLDGSRESWGNIEDANYLIIQGQTKKYGGHFFRPEYNPDPTLEIKDIRSIRGYAVYG